MKIILFGTGCDSCREIAMNIETAIGFVDHNVEFEKTADIEKMLSYGVKSTPSVLIDGTLFSVGRKISVEEIVEALTLQRVRAE